MVTVVKTFVLAELDYPVNHQGLVRVEYDVLDNGNVQIIAYARKLDGSEHMSQVRIVPIEEARENWIALTKRKNWNFVRVK